MGGTDNVLTSTSNTQINTASAGMNAGFIMFAGTLTNTATIAGDSSNTPNIQTTQTKYSGTTPLGAMNGGLFYLKGITQLVTLSDINLQSSFSQGNGGVIYSEVVTNPGVGSASITI